MSEHNEKPASVYQTTYEALFKNYQSGNSQLKPQVKNWEEDLPDKNAGISTAPRMIYCNKMTPSFIEIPRFENIIWHGVWLLLIISVFVLVMSLLSYFYIPPSWGGEFIFDCIIMFFLLSLTLYFVRMAVFVPRGAPVRFNRARQKVYVYEFRRSWNPWVRWRAEVKVFDWADIHGEMIRQIGRYDSGHRLSCAVCKPGTFEVIDRFMLSWTVGHPKMLRGLWSFCCHYMNDQPVPERPLIAKHPRSWCPRNNIHWPEAIDRESTTAAEPQITNIKTEGPNPCL